MWIAFDIETYERFEGTKESRESIINDFLISGDLEQQKRKKKELGKRLEKGFYYPVLNSRKFVIGCAVTSKGEKVSFYRREELLKWIVNKIEENAKKREKTFLYAHNLDYDMLGIIKDDVFKLISGNLDIISSGNPALYSWRVGGKNWGFFVDSYSFFRNMSVETIGNILGYKKLEMPERIKEIDELKEYCLRDCEIVLKGMLFLKEQLKVLGFSPRKFLTAGQVAMSTFMSFIRKENIHWNIMRSGEVFKGENLEKCRPAFRGARNEAFEIGKVLNVSSVDVNSLYPYAMTQIPFPKLDEEMFLKGPLEKGLTIEEILNEKFIGVVECNVFVPKLELGYLPIRFGSKNMLYFPTGERELRGTWTTLELREALKLGYKILKINWCCLYPTMEKNIFKDYVGKMYDLRLKSGEEMKLVIKLILNNLYGKFAQFRMNKEYNVIYRSEFNNWKKRGWSVKSVWGNKYIIEKFNKLYVPKYTNLMIAILITAFGRDYLYKFLSKIKREDLVYCDTDGIIMKNWNNYKSHFKISKRLGDWKLVKEGEDGFVKGEKNYRIGEQIKTSGVSKKVMEGINFDEVESLIQKRKVGIKDVLRNPRENLRRVGSFNDYEISFKVSGKKDLELPKIIDEKKFWVKLTD